MEASTYPTADWEVAAPDRAVDAGRLDGAIDRLMSDRESMGLTQALVVVHRGRIVSEHYGPGGGRDTAMVSWSMAKSITGALVGMAVADGVLSVDDRNLFPRWWADGRAEISLRHLLNMSSGLRWAEDYLDAGVSNVIEMLFGEQDVLPSLDEHGRLDARATRPVDAARYAASMPLDHEPGTRYTYSSGTTNLVARYLADRLGERADSSSVLSGYMADRLFGPLGMTSAKPRFDRAGTFVGSSYVWSTARDFARFGWLFANDGVWRGTRLLPEGWVEFSATEAARDPENGLGYGAHWWTFPDDERSMAALGYEGQYTYISRRRDLVVVRLGATPADLNANLREAIGSVVASFPVRGS